MKLLKDILLYGKELLKVNGFNSYSLEAELLAVKALKLNGREELIFEFEDKVDHLTQDYYVRLIERRLTHEPIAQIIGNKGFWDYEFKVNSDVLTPRSDSETIIEQVLKYFVNKQYNYSILDLGTGSGCLSITLAKIFHKSYTDAVDISSASLEIANHNAILNDVTDRVHFRKRDWFSDLPLKKYDIIVCNPPYIAFDEINNLDIDVKNFEPHIALTDFKDGLTCYRIISQGIGNFMHNNTLAFFEIGINQSNIVKNIFTDNGLDIIDLAHDLNQKERCVIVKKHIF